MSAPGSSSFPKFDDGDVHLNVVLGGSYQLHSSVLKRNSDSLNDLLTDDRALKVTPKSKREGRVLRYRLDLVRSGDEDVGTFELRNLKKGCVSSDTFDMASLGGGRTRHRLHKHYDNLFRAFYNLELEIDDTSIGTVLEDSMALIDCAERLRSMRVVSESIDVALLRHGQVLFQSISTNAIPWSELACRVKSPTIFKEAMIHLVGQWQSISASHRSNLDAAVKALCERRYAELDIRKQAVEVRMLGHYPPSLQRPAKTHPGRMSYSNDIYGWMSVCIFRQWFTQSTCEGRGRTTGDGGAALYRKIGAGGAAYLTRADMESFHHMFPMTAKGSTCLENSLTNLKEELKPFVGYFLKHNSQLDVSEKPLEHLTCCEVTKRDLPWARMPSDDEMELDSEEEEKEEEEEEAEEEVEPSQDENMTEAPAEAVPGADIARNE